MVYWTKVKGQSALRAVPVPQEDRYMKKPSKWKVNALVLLLTAVCIALAVFGVIQLGNVLQKVDEQKALAESTPVPTAEPTPESTPTPEPVRDVRAELLTQMEEAFQDNAVDVVWQIIRFRGDDQTVQQYKREDVAAALVHLKGNDADEQAFYQTLSTAETAGSQEEGGEYFILPDSDLYRLTNTPLPEEEEIEATSITPTPAGGGRLIAIDAGHQAQGNSDQEPVGPGSSQMKAKVASGTSGAASGLKEYELTLAVSLKLKEELLGRGYQVYMIRESNDVDISNAERAQAAAGQGADILVRIHANGVDDSSVHGALTMAPTLQNPYVGNIAAECQRLSEAVVDSFCAATGAKNLGVQQTDDMSGINWSSIPVTIVEMGFMTNTEEDLLMALEDYQNKMAQGIADGIDSYFAQSAEG